MATEHSATQVPQGPVTRLTWADVYKRLAQVVPPGARVYGVPRGGMIAAGLTGGMVVIPETADVILDDLIDSGATRERYLKYGKPFVALYDKQNGDAHLGWIVFPWETETGPEDAVIRLLEYIGENPKRDGLLDTPKRVLKALREMTEGLREDPAAILERRFDLQHDELVVLRDIPFTSLCEHHLLPFTGTAAVAYVPHGGQVVGLSKLARLVQCYARRPQIQERMAGQIADALVQYLEPDGAACVVKAEHSCLACRGARLPGALFITSALRGVLKDDPRARQELMALIG